MTIESLSLAESGLLTANARAANTQAMLRVVDESLARTAELRIQREAEEAERRIAEARDRRLEEAERLEREDAERLTEQAGLQAEAIVLQREREAAYEESARLNLAAEPSKSAALFDALYA